MDMADPLKLTLVQFDIAWESPNANFRKIESLLESGVESTDVIMLPEMFNTGFSMEAEKLAEPVQGQSFLWMKALAKTYDALVIGSVITKTAGKYYNSMLAVEKTGLLYQYDKRHLFHPGGEHKVYTQGESRDTFTFRGFKIFPQICYDLRFPVWTRNDLDYDLLFFIASWPEARVDHWSTLLKARAIDGATLLAAESNEGAFTISIDKSHLAYRKKLNFLSDKDQFTLK